MLAGISVDGCALKPMIIIQRKAYELERFESNFIPDKMLIVHRERAFIVRPLFDLWAESVLYPEIQGPFIEYQHEGNAVLILDGCNSHESDGLLGEALKRNVAVHALAAHSSRKTQVLDLRLFNITRQALTKVRPDSQTSTEST
jgi:hypothetical protein